MKKILNARIIAIKDMHASGVTNNNFFEIINNIRNGLVNPQDRNRFSIQGWVEFLADQFHSVLINENQIALIFEYFRIYLFGLLQFNGAEYSVRLGEQIDYNNYTLEYLIFKAL